MDEIPKIKITKRRGRKGKARTADHWIIDIVFLVRYGTLAGSASSTGPGELKIRVAGSFLPTVEGDFARRPGTVEGYRRVQGRLVWVPPECDSVTEACRLAELHFALKAPRPARAVHPETGEHQEWELPPLIAKRESDGVMAGEGTATRKWLQRALAAELDRLPRWDGWKRELLTENKKIAWLADHRDKKS
jgi:hypothetical protein